MESRGALALVAVPAATAAAELATATAAAATGAVFLGLGLIDGEVAAVVGLAVEGGDGGLRLGVAAHLDEAEALAAAGVAVLDDFRALDGAVLREQLLEVRAGGVVAEIADV